MAQPAERAAVGLAAVSGTGLGIANAVSVGQLTRRVDAIEAELLKLGVTPGATMGIIEDLQADVATLKAEVSTLQREVAQLQGEVAGLQSALNQLSMTVQSDFQSLQAQITALAQRVSTLEAEEARLPPGLGGTPR